MDAVMDTVVEPLMAQWADGPLGEDARTRALGRRYAETVKRAAWLFTRHMRNSRFTTQGTEVAFGEPGGLPPVMLELSDGSRVALRGKIDPGLTATKGTRAFTCGWWTTRAAPNAWSLPACGMGCNYSCCCT